MPILTRWFASEYARLHKIGKAPLAEAFEALRTAFFDEDIPQVQVSLPYVYELSDLYDEQRWRLATDYYAILYEMAWHGNLARSLDLATQAALRAPGILPSGAALGWYLQECLCDAWLSTDCRGYGEDILKVLDSLDPAHLPNEIAARLAIVRAYAETQLDPSYGETALRTILGILPTLSSWEKAYCARLRGLGLMWAGRAEEAAADFAVAIQEFEAMGYRIAANDSRLSQGDALIEAGHIETALEILRAALSAAERLPNYAHLGMIQAAIGRALVKSECLTDAWEWLSAALSTLDGLGWLRTEAEIALIRAQSSAAAILPTASDDLQLAELYAARLRSTDLLITLDELAGLTRGSL